MKKSNFKILPNDDDFVDSAIGENLTKFRSKDQRWYYDRNKDKVIDPDYYKEK